MTDVKDIKDQVKDEVGTCEAAEENLFPELNFSTFILSLSTSALVCMGELPDPLSNEKNVNLPLAKQTITIIEILKDKTKGNLGADEERLIDGILYDLHIRYVKSVC
ncbi:MAG TPA: DUF1844 domain-containing protein [Syntrophorhabdaceae bacterium]|nr:DUF1844 domain-containing protein [Syntrophorhabdaceae bacterium]